MSIYTTIWHVENGMNNGFMPDGYRVELGMYGKLGYAQIYHLGKKIHYLSHEDLDVTVSLVNAYVAGLRQNMSIS